MCNKCNCHGAGLAAFLLGALVGAAAGVLLAPAKGETTRRKLKRLASDAYEDQKEFVLEHAGELKKRAGEVKDKIAERAGEVKDKIAERAGEAKEKLAEGKDKVVKEFNKRKDELAAKFKKEEE